MNYIVFYDDHGEPLKLLAVKPTLQKAKDFVNEYFEDDPITDNEWELSDLQQIEGEVIVFVLGDAQYAIMEID